MRRTRVHAFAVAIPAAVGFDGQQHVLEVDPADVERAGAHLEQYERERLLKAPPPTPDSQSAQRMGWLRDLCLR